MYVYIYIDSKQMLGGGGKAGSTSLTRAGSSGTEGVASSRSKQFVSRSRRKAQQPPAFQFGLLVEAEGNPSQRGGATSLVCDGLRAG